jgi:hypothetical protein
MRSPRHVSNYLGVLGPLIIQEDRLGRLSFHPRSNIDFSFSLVAASMVDEIVN